MQHYLDNIEFLKTSYERVREFVKEYRREKNQGRTDTERNASHDISNKRIYAGGRQRGHNPDNKKPALISTHGYSRNVSQHRLPFETVREAHRN